MSGRQAFAAGAGASVIGWVLFWWLFAWVILPNQNRARGQAAIFKGGRR